MSPVKGLCMTPMTGLPSTATHTMVVTYWDRFSTESERHGERERDRERERERGRGGDSEQERKGLVLW